LGDPTVYDVASKAGVSIATVSRVMNSPDKVSVNTRQKVLNAIDELQYVPKAEALARARKMVGRIGVLTPFFTHSSFIQRMRGIAGALRNIPVELVIYPVDSIQRLEEYLAQLPITRRLDGLIIISLPIREGDAQRLLSAKLETVLIEFEHSSFSSIQIDDQSGGILAGEYLIGKGHKRCAFIGSGELPEYSMHPEDRRLSGFRQAFVSRGNGLNSELIRFPAMSYRDIRNSFQHLMELSEPPTAIFAATDDLAIRILRAAHESGVTVPQDLAIIGFDDIDMAEQIGLTTISQSLVESGRMAVELLLARLNDPTRTVHSNKLPLKVIERETA
jgi:DNA-binding LacI/PurR family transcriptional regulator